jgi:hypothetical protein
MFAGVMMTAMNKELHGQNLLQGWQWVFIISECHGRSGASSLLTNARRCYGNPLRHLWAHVLSQLAGIY